MLVLGLGLGLERQVLVNSRRQPVDLGLCGL